MTPVVLVHGGMHGAWCWDPVLPFLGTPSVAVDLPGRGTRPADLSKVRLDDSVAAVLEDADRAGFERFVLVDAPGLMNAVVSGYPSGMPITYVSMTLDQPVPPALAAQMAANLGPHAEHRSSPKRATRS